MRIPFSKFPPGTILEWGLWRYEIKDQTYDKYLLETGVLEKSDIPIKGASLPKNQLKVFLPKLKVIKELKWI